MKFSIHVIPSLSSFASIVRVQFVPFLHRRLLSSAKSWEMETVISGEWQTLNYNLLKIFRMSLLMKRKFCMLWIFGVIFPSLSFSSLFAISEGHEKFFEFEMWSSEEI